MLIGNEYKVSQLHTCNDFTIKVNYTPLERVIKDIQHKSLGVHIDQSLTWRPHINAI